MSSTFHLKNACSAISPPPPSPFSSLSHYFSNFRSPEALLQAGWSFATDIWSLGLVIAEIHLGIDSLFPFCVPSLHLHLMSRVLQAPIPPSLISTGLSNRNQHNVGLFVCDASGVPQPRLATTSEHRRAMNGRATLWSRVDDKTLTSLLHGMLAVDPAKRVSAKTALAYSYVNGTSSTCPSSTTATTDASSK